MQVKSLEWNDKNSGTNSVHTFSTPFLNYFGQEPTESQKQTNSFTDYANRKIKSINTNKNRMVYIQTNKPYQKS